jgi:hypothetical protein
LLYNGTFSSTIGDIGTDVYINYTKPSTATGANWTIKHGLETAYNVSIPAECFKDTIQLRLYSLIKLTNPKYTSYGECYDGASWTTISNISTSNEAGAGTLGSPCSAQLNDGDWNTGCVNNQIVPTFGWNNGASGIIAYGYIYEEAMWWTSGNYNGIKFADNGTTTFSNSNITAPYISRLTGDIGVNAVFIFNQISSLLIR